LSAIQDSFLDLAERRTRKSLAGCDYGSAGIYYMEFFSRMAEMTGRPAEWLWAWYFDHYLPRMARILKKYYQPRPGMSALFSRLAKSSVPFAVYSDYPETAERLSFLGLSPTHGRLYGPEHFGAQKPAARPFITIAGELGVAPGHTLVVGDREDTDGAGAAAAGMGYIRVDSETWNLLYPLFRERFGLPNRRR
jgi:HAD superfamily hydrolase (TIGR01549 family)